MPIRRKVALAILVTCSAGLVVACVFLAMYQMSNFRRNMLRNTTVLADVLAKTTQAALTFQDEASAEKTLHSVEAEPNVAGICLYSRDNKLFAGYYREKSDYKFPEAAPPDGTQVDADHLQMVRPILLNEKRIGSILLRMDLQALYDRLKLFAAVAGAVLLGSCALALLLAVPLQRTISQPLVNLTDTVRSISARRDYAVRLPATGQDEIGALTAAFNHFLASLEERDKALLSANDSLRASQSQLQTIVESIGEGVIVSDLQGDLLHFNRAALDIHGFATIEECRGALSSLAEIFELSSIDGDLWTVEQWPLSRILRGEKLRNLEVRVHRRDAGWDRIFNYGGTLVLDGQGKPMMAVVTASDITERKLSEKKISEQMARMALLNEITRATGERLDIKSVFQVVVGTLEDQMPLDFCCICLHDAAAETLTVACIGSRSQESAQTLLMSPQDQFPVGENGLGRCTRGQVVYEPDVLGSIHPFPKRLAEAGLNAFVATPLSVESKAFGILIAARCDRESFSSRECEFLRQVSEHVALSAHQAQLHAALQQAYDDLRQTQQSVMQQERLRALGQMASGIAHDINNAISPVALYTESLLETEPNLSTRARDYLQTIQNSIEDVAQTVARMREFYRQRETQLTFTPVQLNSLLQQVVELSRARWSDMPQQRGCHVELTTELSTDLPVVAGVESEIREALLNLVFNAVDAMPDGGKLTLRTRTIPPADDEAEPRDLVAVEVSDTGMGMDEDTRRRCLEPFFTTKGERGTGLGLAMVYGIAQRHGAEIEIDSQTGRGTTMRLVFPPPAVPLQASVPLGPAAMPNARMRILVVDDDPLLIKSLRDTLETDGHVVTAASGGQAGIDAFVTAQERRQAFSVVITDLGMPYVDGRKVAAAVKSASPGTPVILLTGWGQRLVAEGDIPPHVNKVLNKPPKLRELREALAWCQNQAGKTT